MTLPKDWKYYQLKDISEIVRGSSPRPAGSPKYFNGNFLPWITVAEVTSNSKMYLDSTRTALTNEGAKHTRILESGTLILTNSGATLGVPKITKIEAGANDGIAAFLSIKPNYSKKFLYYFLQSKTKYFRERLAPGVGQPNLNTELIGTVDFLCPSLPEQKKIAEILSTWDKAIETCEKVLIAKQKRKRVLMQRLLTGKQRFPQFQNKEWKTVRLGDVARNSALRNNLGMTSENLMAVTKSSGIIPMREQVQGKTVDRCKVVQPNWFAYNPMRLNIGSIARWTGSEKVMVSPDYVVFKCDEKYLKPEYLDHFRKTCFWSQFVNRSGDGSVRVRIYFSHLEDMKISLPSIGEQEKIAETLNAADREIELLKQQRDALKRQKRGLMQKLLTGKVRVRVDEIEKNNSANSDI